VARSNHWLSAFYWIRANTPKDAVFALGPDYMKSRGEDAHGFRAIAERSMLADSAKDSGAVSLFPELADEWKAESQAQSGWKQFGPNEFGRLARRYPVGWVITQRSASAGLSCPYENVELAVCHIAPDTSVSNTVNAAVTAGHSSGRPQPLGGVQEGRSPYD
jgi:hypothetical protein